MGSARKLYSIRCFENVSFRRTTEHLELFFTKPKKRFPNHLVPQIQEKIMKNYLGELPTNNYITIETSRTFPKYVLYFSTLEADFDESGRSKQLNISSKPFITIISFLSLKKRREFTIYIGPSSTLFTNVRIN